MKDVGCHILSLGRCSLFRVFRFLIIVKWISMKTFLVRFSSLIMAYVMLIYSIVKAILSNVPRLSFCLCVSEWDLSSWIAFFDRGMIRGRISLGTSTGPFSIWIILSILKNSVWWVWSQDQPLFGRAWKLINYGLVGKWDLPTPWGRVLGIKKA